MLELLLEKLASDENKDKTFILTFNVKDEAHTRWGKRSSIDIKRGIISMDCESQRCFYKLDSILCFSIE